MFHFYFLTVRLLYFKMLWFQSSVTDNCIVCYVSRRSASRLKEVIYFIYWWSNIWDSVSNFGLLHTKKRCRQAGEGLQDGRGRCNEESLCVGFGLFSLRRRVRLWRDLIVLCHPVSVEKRQTFLVGAPQKAANKPSQNFPPQKLKGKKQFSQWVSTESSCWEGWGSSILGRFFGSWLNRALSSLIWPWSSLCLG